MAIPILQMRNTECQVFKGLTQYYRSLVQSQNKIQGLLILYAFCPMEYSFLENKTTTNNVDDNSNSYHLLSALYVLGT